MNHKQITHNIVMIRPANFGYNPETALSNSFQKKDGDLSDKEITALARAEFDAFVYLLKEKEIQVRVFEDVKDPKCPDAIFPNNWVSLHQDGLVISYPMAAPTRRLERRQDIIRDISRDFIVDRDYTFENYEDSDRFLEGTGSLILDRENKIVYAALSNRTDVSVLDKWCILMGYEKVHFTSVDRKGDAIYHTNVMMALGLDFAIVALDSIPNEDERSRLKLKLESTGKQIINITNDQVEQFAGNMLQLSSQNGAHHLVMSSTAYHSLTKDQIAQIEAKTNILHAPIPTIEKYGGGSVRCMIAENFLPEKKK